jgi:transposase
MAKELVSDELWELIEPLLPEEPPKPRGGTPRIDDRAALTGIIFVLKSGIPWEMLPQEMGCASGMSCWRRLKEWHEAGVWEESLSPTTVKAAYLTQDRDARRTWRAGRSRRAPLSRPTLRRSTPIATTALPFTMQLSLEGVMSMRLIAQE